MKLLTNYTKSICNETAAAYCDATVTLANEEFARLYNDIDVCTVDLQETIDSTNVNI